MPSRLHRGLIRPNFGPNRPFTALSTDASAACARTTAAFFVSTPTLRTCSAFLRVWTRCLCKLSTRRSCQLISADAARFARTASFRPSCTSRPPPCGPIIVSHRAFVDTRQSWRSPSGRQDMRPQITTAPLHGQTCCALVAFRRYPGAVENKRSGSSRLRRRALWRR